ncbi:hypothetical protein GGD67_002967 [Bradyrhizobium sp. IAR9]|uniref:hypothetical protein n=1 Tax=Bradyrhizobium sp. IAR9 TaxID=2663841 RepID=UPI0015C8229A|nr:hypothetical protein [Bradyrhizobium sp. IAR9]NYG45509.1 hypothetical protein [Bradyrhizobium sp. IAR9]
MAVVVAALAVSFKTSFVSSATTAPPATAYYGKNRHRFFIKNTQPALACRLPEDMTKPLDYDARSASGPGIQMNLPA